MSMDKVLQAISSLRHEVETYKQSITHYKNLNALLEMENSKLKHENEQLLRTLLQFEGADLDGYF
jgi:regulator of replication initiation timing